MCCVCSFGREVLQSEVAKNIRKYLMCGLSEGVRRGEIVRVVTMGRGGGSFPLGPQNLPVVQRVEVCPPHQNLGGGGGGGHHTLHVKSC